MVSVMFIAISWALPSPNEVCHETSYSIHMCVPASGSIAGALPPAAREALHMTVGRVDRRERR